MLKNIKMIFDIMPKVFSVVLSVITLIEVMQEIIKEGDTSGEEKHKEAADIIREIVEDAIDKGYLPEWADIFIDNKFLDWLITVFVKIAEWRGFFEKIEEEF